MAPPNKLDSASLAKKLGHNFTTPRLLEEALTHPSLSGTQKQHRRADALPYERMEFLGDRVLGLVIAEWLYENFPKANEGELAKRHAALVNREALRIVAQDIGLGQFVRLAHGEEAGASGRKNLATLSDAMEAVIGALYLDGGLIAARIFIRQYWQRDIAVSETPADPKTSLQEWAQKKGGALPVYRVINHSGPAHAPKFMIEASVQGFPPVQVEGDSKREAQKKAAAKLLELVHKK